MGEHLARCHNFSLKVHRSDLEAISGIHADVLVCAGLPAEKWRANQDPHSDWVNMARLAQTLTTVQARRAVLISTIDVYQPPVEVSESNPPTFNGMQAYGAHRAWFEMFFQAQFPDSLVLRLPALFAPDVRKNLVHDLLFNKADQWKNVNPDSTFQYFDVRHTWTMIERAWIEGINVLNIATEPIRAQQIADIFDIGLSSVSTPVHYQMYSNHAETLGGHANYLYSSASILAGISALHESRFIR